MYPHMIFLFCAHSTLPHDLIKGKLLDLIERTFKREETFYFACNDKKAFLTSTDHRRYKLWSCQNVCDALSYLLDNNYYLHKIWY